MVPIQRIRSRLAERARMSTHMTHLGAGHLVLCFWGRHWGGVTSHVPDMAHTPTVRAWVGSRGGACACRPPEPRTRPCCSTGASVPFQTRLGMDDVPEIRTWPTRPPARLISRHDQQPPPDGVGRKSQADAGCSIRAGSQIPAPVMMPTASPGRRQRRKGRRGHLLTKRRHSTVL